MVRFGICVEKKEKKSKALNLTHAQTFFASKKRFRYLCLFRFVHNILDVKIVLKNSPASFCKMVSSKCVVKDDAVGCLPGQFSGQTFRSDFSG